MSSGQEEQGAGGAGEPEKQGPPALLESARPPQGPVQIREHLWCGRFRRPELQTCRAAKIIKNHAKKGGLNINHMRGITSFISGTDRKAGFKSGASGGAAAGD